MSLYNTIKNFEKETILAGSLVAMLTGCSLPTIEQNKDLTGDNITDIIVSIKSGAQSGTWLFIGQQDGSFVRATRHYGPDSTIYYMTDDRKAYFFDGEFYKQSLKE
ncbi:hypothetical protein HYW21_00770 [Candidatus Woesearchaeota archaeon]|nr:hypothetical protein [Candidatus Woesearchaeota archaeon]